MGNSPCCSDKDVMKQNRTTDRTTAIAHDKSPSGEPDASPGNETTQSTPRVRQLCDVKMDQWIFVAEYQCKMLGTATLFDRMETALYELIAKYLYIEPEPIDELHRVNASELGSFITKKMNNRTLDRLWKHLDEDDSGHISHEKVLNILQWMSVLYVAFRFRVCI